MERKSNDNIETLFPLERAYTLSKGISIEDENGVSYIVQPQNHPIQNFFRKLTIKIPKYQKTELDKFGSFVLKMVEEKRTIKEIGEALKKEFNEEAEPIYPRLMAYLEYLEKTKMIEII